MSSVFIRGSKVRLLIVPDMLQNAPMFKRIDPKLKDAKIIMGTGTAGAMADAAARGRGRGRGGGGRGGRGRGRG